MIRHVHNFNADREPTWAWVVRTVVVPAAHQILKPRFNICVSHKGKTVDSETSVVTSSISIFDPLAQFFEGARRGRVCVCAFIGVRCMRVYVTVCVCTVFLKKLQCEYMRDYVRMSPNRPPFSLGLIFFFFAYFHHFSYFRHFYMYTVYINKIVHTIK
jgi:hypothetical protein